MTIDELREQLDAFGLPGHTPIVLTKDGEVNDGASQLASLTTALYEAETKWAGCLHMTEEQRYATGEPDEYDEAPAGSVLVAVLNPTN